MGNHIDQGYVRGTIATTLLVGFFAACWGVAGSTAFAGGIRTALLAVVALVTAYLIGMAVFFARSLRKMPAANASTPNPFATRTYQLAVLAEIIAIPLAARLLSSSGHADAIIAAVAIIVGLHFFGLVSTFRSWRFAVVGGAMVLLGLASLALPPMIAVAGTNNMIALRSAVVGWSSAIALWCGIASLVFATFQAVRATR